MAATHRDPRTREVPPELRDRARELLAQRGPRGAAAALGLSRSAVLSVVAVGRATPGTLAILRESTGRRSA